jgi:hypothetical protein
MKKIKFRPFRKTFPLLYKSAIRLEWLKVLWKSKLSLIVILILLYFFWFNDQGKDLFVSLQDDSPLWRIFLFYLLVFILACLNWYWPRYLSVPKETKINLFGKEPEFEFRLNKISKASIIIPRFIGAFTIIIVSASIFNIWITQYKNYNSLYSLLYLAGTTIFISLLFSEKFSIWLKKFIKHKYILWLIITLFIFLLGYSIYKNFTKTHDILIYSLGFLWLTIIFAFITILRKETKFYFRILLWIKKIRVPNLIFISAYILMILFIIVNIYIELAPKISPIQIFLLGIIFYTMLFNQLYFYLRRSPLNALIGLILLVILIIVYFVLPDKHYYVRIDKNIDTERLEIRTYIKNWIKYRETDILRYKQKNLKYPIFVLASHGGGSRSAYWTTLITTRLNDSTKGEFSKHLIALSGISGGSEGIAFYTALLAHKQRNNLPDTISRIIDKILRRDYLSSSVAMMLGRDFWLSFIPGINASDRAAVFEKEWGNTLDEVLKDTTYHWFEKNINELYYSHDSVNYLLPLIFLNTTQVSEGQRAIISPVKTGNNFIMAYDLIDSINKYSGINSSLKLSTSALLSARFPYINPAGKIDSLGYFVDGGYFERSGALTASEIINEIDKALKEYPDTNISKNINIYAISIVNAINNKPKKIFNSKIFFRDRYLSQVVMPPLTLFYTRLAHSDYSDTIFRRSVEPNKYFRLRLTREKITITYNHNTDTIYPIIPLGRYLSDQATKSIKASFDEKENKATISKIIDLLN